MPRLTSTSYALLALLGLREWSTYELARQLPRSVGLIWPRAEARLYAEARRLADAGLAATRAEPTGRRPRTVYRITEEGRRALAEWLAEPGAGPALEFEGMLKVAFAEHGRLEDLVRQLTRIARDAERMLATGDAVAGEYLAGRGAFPDRLHVSGLAWRFLHDHHTAVRDWATWALAEVATWPDVDAPPGGPAAAFARYVER
ncbi:MAG: PadR family transcriptional regulator [Pseudonocardia sp.]